MRKVLLRQLQGDGLQKSVRHPSGRSVSDVSSPLSPILIVSKQPETAFFTNKKGVRGRKIGRWPLWFYQQRVLCTSKVLAADKWDASGALFFPTAARTQCVKVWPGWCLCILYTRILYTYSILMTLLKTATLSNKNWVNANESLNLWPVTVTMIRFHDIDHQQLSQLSRVRRIGGCRDDQHVGFHRIWSWSLLVKLEAWDRVVQRWNHRNITCENIAKSLDQNIWRTQVFWKPSSWRTWENTNENTVGTSRRWVFQCFLCDVEDLHSCANLVRPLSALTSFDLVAFACRKFLRSQERLYNRKDFESAFFKHLKYF